MDIGIGAALPSVKIIAVNIEEIILIEAQSFAQSNMPRENWCGGMIIGAGLHTGNLEVVGSEIIIGFTAARR